MDAPTFSDTEAEIGEAVDFVVHVERQLVRRIVCEVLEGPRLLGVSEDATGQADPFHVARP
ncbi:MAG: hypothetical protein LAO30_07485 [Acidobacteriia bacterium]|nr:hypothetical protein [Terriglobia bacterium]